MKRAEKFSWELVEPQHPKGFEQPKYDQLS